MLAAIGPQQPRAAQPRTAQCLALRRADDRKARPPRIEPTVLRIHFHSMCREFTFTLTVPMSNLKKKAMCERVKVTNGPLRLSHRNQVPAVSCTLTVRHSALAPRQESSGTTRRTDRQVLSPSLLLRLGPTTMCRYPARRPIPTRTSRLQAREQEVQSEKRFSAVGNVLPLGGGSSVSQKANAALRPSAQRKLRQTSSLIYASQRTMA